MKIVSHIAVVVLILAVVFAPVAAATASASVTGPAVVRAGGQITVNINLNGTNLMAAQGDLLYNPSIMVYQTVGSQLAGWSVDVNATSGKLSFLAIDDTLTHPINASTRLFSATFKVVGNLATGTDISVTGSAFKVSDGSSDFTPALANYSVKLAAPVSTNADLASLSIAEGSISPAFNKGTTSYTLAVPFETPAVTVSAKAADAGARLKIVNPELTVGGITTVSVLVTAASGNKKEYLVAVSRAQDPNYVPSTNNSLSGIQLSSGQLSPAFSKEVREYVVYLPYETDRLTVEATPEDSRAIIAVEGGSDLQVGQNNIMRVSCTAENGTVQTYTVYIVRAPQFSGFSPTTPTTGTMSPTTTMVTPPATQPTTTAVPTTAETTGQQTGNQAGTPPAGLLVAFISVGMILIILFGYHAYRSKMKK